MVHRVAEQVVERRVELFEDFAVHLRHLADDLQLGLLAELPGQIADQPRKALHAVSKRTHAAGNHLAIQAAVQIVRAAGVVLEGHDPVRQQAVAIGQPAAQLGHQFTAPLATRVGRERLQEFVEFVAQMSLLGLQVLQRIRERLQPAGLDQRFASQAHEP